MPSTNLNSKFEWEVCRLNFIIVKVRVDVDGQMVVAVSLRHRRRRWLYGLLLIQANLRLLGSGHVATATTARGGRSGSNLQSRRDRHLRVQILKVVHRLSVAVGVTAASAVRRSTAHLGTLVVTRDHTARRVTIYIQIDVGIGHLLLQISQIRQILQVSVLQVDARIRYGIADHRTECVLIFEANILVVLCFSVVVSTRATILGYVVVQSAYILLTVVHRLGFNKVASFTFLGVALVKNKNKSLKVSG